MTTLGARMSQTEARGGQRILWVDDDPGMQLILSRHLRGQLGAELVCVGSGEEALAWLSENPAPDLLLFDYEMPGVNGADLCRAARASQKLSHVPIVLLSGELLPVELVQRIGANEALLKPCPPSSLVSVLRAYLHSTPPLAQELSDLKRNYAQQLLREAERVRELGHALSAGRPTAPDDLKKFLHRLGGTAGTYGFLQVTVATTRIRAKLDTAEPGELESDLSALVAQLMALGLSP